MEIYSSYIQPDWNIKVTKSITHPVKGVLMIMLLFISYNYDIFFIFTAYGGGTQRLWQGLCHMLPYNLCHTINTRHYLGFKAHQTKLLVHSRNDKFIIYFDPRLLAIYNNNKY